MLLRGTSSEKYNLVAHSLSRAQRKLTKHNGQGTEKKGRTQLVNTWRVGQEYVSVHALAHCAMPLADTQRHRGSVQGNECSSAHGVRGR